MGTLDADHHSAADPYLNRHDEQAVMQAVVDDPICATILDRLPDLGLPEWWLTAGAVFQNVWNSVVGNRAGYGVRDYDVFYFDAGDLSWEAEDRVIRAAAKLFSDQTARIEVRNQARVHLWYEDKFGTPTEPLTSATDAIDTFASTTCCVAITRDSDGLRVHAPYGLSDVFAMHMRPHHRLAPREVYEAKVQQYTARWPSLTSDPW